MLIFVYGEDTYRSLEKFKSLKEHFQSKYDPTGLNINEFRDKPKLGEIAQAVQSMPFMSERRFVIVEGLVSSITTKANAAEWIDVLAKTTDSSIVMFYDEIAVKDITKRPLYKSLQKQKEVYNYPFPYLNPTEENKWIIGRVVELGGQVSPVAASMIVQMVGSDLWQVNGELEKLVAYSDGETITPDMISKLVRGRFEDRIFDFVDAVSQKRGRDVIRLIDEERQSGATDQYIMSMLARQVRILLGVKSYLEENPQVAKQTVAKELSLHPFVAGKAIAQAKNFGQSELERALIALADYDLEIKTGKIKPDFALDKFVSEIVV